MPFRLFQNTFADIHENQCDVRGRRSGDHVAGVLNVTRRVGQNELPPRSGEVAIRNVNRDALLALSSKPIGQEGKVDVIGPESLGGGFYCF